MNAIALLFFVLVLAMTFVITWWASRRNKSISQFYTAGGGITAGQNGWAIAGDYLSGASLLGIVGAISLNGFSGFYYSIGFLVAYLVVLYIVAEPLRNLGKFTLADALTSRFNVQSVRAAAALNTIVISTFYLITQIVGAGTIIKLLLGWDFTTSVIVIGILMTVYVTFGGMLATTWVQVIKAVLLVFGSLVLTLMVLYRFHFNPMLFFDTVKEKLGNQLLLPPPPSTLVAGLDTLSFNLALVLGTAGLPHILIRFFTVPDAPAARKSVVYATFIIGSFYLMTPILGYGAALLVGKEAIVQANAAGNLAAPLLGRFLGGDIFMAFILVIAFISILAVIAGLVIAATSAFAHDFYSHVFRKGMISEKEQIRVARYASVVMSLLAILLASGLQKVNIAYLVSLTFSVAASANLPVIMLTLFWRNFNTRGAVWGMVGGLVSTIGLLLISPNVMGKSSAIFPLSNTALVSVPLGFLFAYLGTKLSAQKEDGNFEEILVRANTGINAFEAR
jgi:cation/acetate symporter